ncbi:adenosylcobinamide-GDP ribazoletransferase [Sulfurimonas marina]|uniref:Adenosylcobinamide-GDP ribazoletransferase n=1 Tax=Sulfurimonas marina TaxID=2590551 RepID=A0A7M3V935_9BACT|nr:adenosylcobinamide-GDP ribazoletransferase [Sulfurimonas marina]QOP40268.1 adenosylcobinamide-GDP ribazoletransferase [Sulfurimonas marina]
MSYFKAFALAFNMFTIFPFFKIHTYEDGINGRSALFYPFIGLIIGFTVYGLYLLLHDYLPAPHLAVLLFGLSILFTGALHLDGLSDTIDGFFVNKEKALEVMKDSHVGGMGMIFTFVFLSLKLSSFIYFEAWALLPLVMLLSRLNATLAIYIFPYISSGVGALIKQELKTTYVVIALLYSVVLSYLFSSTLMLLISLVSMFIIAGLLIRRYKGLNGDMYGFIIEISELILLNYLIIL